MENFGNTQHTVVEIKADKQPVGAYRKSSPFTSHTLEVYKGDALYLFSDGYPDQFGGENLSLKKAGGKKFKTKNLKRLLLSLQSESMDAQKSALERTFDDWKGDLEQIDDVCIIEIRV